MRRSLRNVATIAAIATLGSIVAVSPARAQDVCGNDVNDPCSSATAWYSTYSMADTMRLQRIIDLQNQSHDVLSSLIDSYNNAYRGIVLYIN